MPWCNGCVPAPTFAALYELREVPMRSNHLHESISEKRGGKSKGLRKPDERPEIQHPQSRALPERVSFSSRNAFLPSCRNTKTTFYPIALSPRTPFPSRKPSWHRNPLRATNSRQHMLENNGGSSEAISNLHSAPNFALPERAYPTSTFATFAPSPRFPFPPLKPSFLPSAAPVHKDLPGNAS